MTVSKFLFGTGNENEIRVGFPLFDILTDREDGAASEYIDMPDGSVDTWRQDKMFTMDTEARWIPDGPGTNPVQTQLSGPVSWEEFIDWVRDGRPIRFVPDENVPDFYVDNTYIVEPRKGFGSLSTDIKRNVPLKMRNPLISFHQAMRGIMFEYAPGTSLIDPVAYSFLRATAATRRGLPSAAMASAIGASDLVNVLRDRHYEGSLKTALLEAARSGATGKQLVTDPENFGNWTAQGTIGRTGGQPDPYGGTNAWLFDSNTPASGDAFFEAVTFTGDGTKAVLAHARFDNSPQSDILVFDNTAAVERCRIRLTWTNGVPAAAIQNGAGTIYSVIPMGAGWYEIKFAANNIVAANANRILLYPDPTGTGAHTYFFGANAWNDVFPSSYQGPAISDRSADILNAPHLYKPQAIFVHTKFVHRCHARGPGTVRPWRIGTGTTGAAETTFYLTNNAGYGLRLRIAGNSTSATVGGTPAVGDLVDLLGTITSAGLMQLSMALNSGVPTVGGAAGAQALPGAWDSLVFGIEDTGDGAAAYARVKVGCLTFGGVTRDTIAKALAA